MAEQATKRGRGCLFYVLVIGGVVALILVAGALAGLSMARKMVRDYTDSQPVVLPAVTLGAEEAERLHERVEEFQQKLRQQRRTEPLVLNADELNTLLATSPAAQSLSNRIHARIDGATLKGDLSLPLEALGLPVFRGRYLNGTATFDVELKDGHLLVRTERLLVKGRELPKIYMDKIRAHNLAAKVNTDPRASLALERLQEVQVQDGKLLIVPRNAP